MHKWGEILMHDLSSNWGCKYCRWRPHTLTGEDMRHRITTERIGGGGTRSSQNCLLQGKVCLLCEKLSKNWAGWIPDLKISIIGASHCQTLAEIEMFIYIWRKVERMWRKTWERQLLWLPPATKAQWVCCVYIWKDINKVWLVWKCNRLDALYRLLLCLLVWGLCGGSGQHNVINMLIYLFWAVTAQY